MIRRSNWMTHQSMDWLASGLLRNRRRLAMTTFQTSSNNSSTAVTIRRGSGRKL
jgi:hypothetical protein